jgi:predicted RNA-binding Zn-ribbon protein involved in translation (DUF1610 family)
MRCPNCGSENFLTWGFDFGFDSETGYHDTGVRAKCNACGHEADVEDFQEREDGTSTSGKQPASDCRL